MALKTPWDDGTFQILVSPLELLEKLAALVPPPRIHLIRYHGVLAPNARDRALIVPGTATTDHANEDTTGHTPLSPSQRRTWAALLARVFLVGALLCPRCGGRVRLVAALTDAHSIRQYLTGVGLRAAGSPAGTAPWSLSAPPPHGAVSGRGAFLHGFLLPSTFVTKAPTPGPASCIQREQPSKETAVGRGVQSREELLQALRSSSPQLSDLGVLRLGVFGSFGRDEATPTSDVDLLVQFRPGCKSFDTFMGLADFLEALLDRRVELITPESLSPYIGPHILAHVEYVPIAA